MLKVDGFGGIEEGAPDFVDRGSRLVDVDLRKSQRCQSPNRQRSALSPLHCFFLGFLHEHNISISLWLFMRQLET